MGTHVALKEARLASSPLELCRLVNEALRVVTLHGTASNAYRGNIRSSRVRRGRLTGSSPEPRRFFHRARWEPPPNRCAVRGRIRSREAI